MNIIDARKRFQTDDERILLVRVLAELERVEARLQELEQLARGDVKARIAQALEAIADHLAPHRPVPPEVAAWVPSTSDATEPV